MTAFDNIDRLEGPGVWRPTPQAQRQNVYVSFGEATLTLTDSASRPLAHWSLPALHRVNPGQTPALYSPDPDSTETLELDDTTLIDAMDRIRRHTAKGRARPGRLRLLTFGAILTATVIAALWGLPQLVASYASRAAPDAVRDRIDRALITEISRFTGAPCTSTAGDAALHRLTSHVAPGTPATVLSGELAAPLRLPGGTLLLDRAMVELPDDPAVTAGELIAAQTAPGDPLAALLRDAPISASFHLLTKGDLPAPAVARAARSLISQHPPLADTETLTARFAEHNVAMSPWTTYRASLGEEITPSATGNAALLTDQEWLALQSICIGS